MAGIGVTSGSGGTYGGFNQTKSTSTGTPGLLNSPTSDWEYQLSQILGALGQYQYNWAQNQFAKTSAVTDEQINNYLTQAQTGAGMANNLLGRYESIFQPLEDQYVQEAGSYASDARKKFNMGAAQSASEQASQQGLDNATRTLQSYGIDPSSGRYADLVNSQKTAAAAAAAGAGQQAELATEQTGRGMQEKAIAMGQQIPGQTVNALNSAYQGIAGAENSALGNANTGATLTDSANPFFSSAMQAKLPSVGNTTGSTSTGMGTTSPGGGGGAGQIHDPDQGGGQNTGGGRAGGGQQGGYGGYNAGTGNAGLPFDARQSQADLSGIGPPGQDPLYDPNNGASSQYMNDGLDSGNVDIGTPQEDPYSSGIGDTSQSYGGGYAQGGGVLPDGNATGQGGGHVPASMSPSGGQQTDDIPGVIPQTGGQARLNADEFVIPKDVAMWKGQEFFQKLIDGSRKARMGAPAKPTRGTPSMGAQHGGV